MGRYIEVNHSDLEAAASDIESNMVAHDKGLDNALTQVTLLQNEWSGSDFDAFKYTFEGENGAIETGQKVSKELKQRAVFLRYCANQYKAAQADAVNRANSIPVW